MAKKATATVDKETNDKDVGGDGLTVLRCIDESFREAEEAKRRRMALNRQNMNAYMGQQDWSHKQAGQSREFLPKTPVAVEQFSAFIKKGLVEFGDWFSVDAPPESPLMDYQIRSLVMLYIGHLADGMRDTTTFDLRISDACKMGLLESVMTFKVHGYQVPERAFMAERGTKIIDTEDGLQRVVPTTKLKQKFRYPWRLAIDGVRAADYFPDPTGRKLYEIHRVERDLHDVMELADQGLYEPNVVDRIMEDFNDRTKLYEDNATRNQQGVPPPSFRKTVIIDEYWGDLLDSEGHLVDRNIVSARANEKYLIREPESNPYWHGESPFVSFPLIRVPDTVWHKALFDHASPLNIALNELFNLMLDGGMASVWGIKQVRTSWLEDPRQVSGGIPQGITLAVNDECPADGKVLETVATGDVPQQGLLMYNLADSEFGQAALTNELNRGMFPDKEVKATEVVEMAQAQSVTLAGIVRDMESGIGKIIHKSFLTILQNADDLDADDVILAIGSRGAWMLSQMSKAERFAMFAKGIGFKVHGLSATMARVRDFQKFAAMQQLIMQNPILAESFMRRFSGDKNLDWMFKSLSINPDDLGLEPAEQKDLPNRVNRMAAISQMFGTSGSQGGAMKNDTSGGSASPPAEVNQAANPLTGMMG